MGKTPDDAVQEYELDSYPGSAAETQVFLPGAPEVAPEHAPPKPPVLVRVVRFLCKPDILLALVSLLLFTLLSAYFEMPSTLQLYMTAMLFTLPTALVLDASQLVARRGLTRARTVRLALASAAVLYMIVCIVTGGLAVIPSYAQPRSSPLRTNETVFIASNLYNSEAILPQYRDSLLSAVDALGTANVFVSIYENNSKDNTPAMLKQLDGALAHRGIARRIVTGSRDPSFRKLPRIERMAILRNAAMEPLYQQDGNAWRRGRSVDKVLWLNDILFDPDAIYELLATNDGAFDQVCAIDYYQLGLYDTWVTRDVDSVRPRPLWPFFVRGQDQRSVASMQPVTVNACWNGMAAFHGHWFLPDTNSSAARPGKKQQGAAIDALPRPVPGKEHDGMEPPARLPIRFRTNPGCVISECLLPSIDMHRIAAPLRPRILMNPKVAVAYNRPQYFQFAHMIRWRLVWPWRAVWQDIIANRIFGRLGDLGRKDDACSYVYASRWVPPGADST